MFARATICMAGLSLRPNFIIHQKQPYIVVQQNAKTGIVLPFDAKIITKMKNRYLKYRL